MASIPVFGRREAEKALKILGFDIYEDRGKGGHGLAKHPLRKPDPLRQIANITIPHVKGKSYDNPDLRNDFVKEIMAFGFSKDEVLLALRGRKPRSLDQDTTLT